VLDAVAFHGRELVFVNALGVVQQPADQGGLAVVHRSAGEEPQQLLALVALEVGVDVFAERFDLLHRCQCVMRNA
jgi:hypothetical protein